MPQAMYVHPTGEPATPRGFAYNKRVTFKAIYRQVQKLLKKDIGEGWERVEYHTADATIDQIVFRLTNGGFIVVDRKANALGR